MPVLPIFLRHLHHLFALPDLRHQLLSLEQPVRAGVQCGNIGQSDLPTLRSKLCYLQQHHRSVLSMRKQLSAIQQHLPDCLSQQLTNQ